MNKAAEWARGQVWESVERGKGRVTPGESRNVYLMPLTLADFSQYYTLLDSVKVTLEDGAHPLQEIASITVRGQALQLEVWDPDLTKSVEAALHKANLPGLHPQKISPGVLKIPVSRPTAEQRTEILRALGTSIETAKQQVRQARQAGLKSLGKGTEGGNAVQKISEDVGGELDGLLAKAKKEFEKSLPLKQCSNVPADTPPMARIVRTVKGDYVQQSITPEQPMLDVQMPDTSYTPWALVLIDPHLELA
ncbi:hypothetical protein M231_02135 [Tremella mesenterica]|uniref:Ribosome recycling factor domain-containing protein n=1 Tax=Tremella mesenterica TaxID=5217 RepID=A0A4V1M4K4_TREME|nr:hypothetical protein M231_02135 [Tremella mesenterica]